MTKHVSLPNYVFSDGTGHLYILTPTQYSSILVLDTIVDTDAGVYSCLFPPNHRVTVTLNIASKYLKMCSGNATIKILEEKGVGKILKIHVSSHQITESQSHFILQVSIEKCAVAMPPSKF